MADIQDADQQTIDPSSGKWELNGKEYEVKPPKMRHLGRMMRFSSLFKKIEDGEKVEDSDLDEAENKLDETIRELVPDLPEENVSQLPINEKMGAVTVIAELSTPADSKLLESKGVAPKDSKKK